MKEDKANASAKAGAKANADANTTATAPLLEAMVAYAAGGRLGFHMPGHQQGKGLQPAFARLLDSYGTALDLTELPGLDNLAAPTGSIAQSQEAMAALAGAREAYYMVNGSSGGLEAAILAMSGPDIPTLMPAYSHTAIYHGLVLSGSRPVILPCLVDPQWELPLGMDKEAVERYLAGGAQSQNVPVRQETQPAQALWITVNPTYHGLFADLAWERGIAETRPGWGWLADEAHGAHLLIAKKQINTKIKNGIMQRAEDATIEQRSSALPYGAQVVVQSAHKMGLGFTQTAILYCNSEALSGKIRQAVNILQSSSPSYLLLASLDAWQAYLQEDGPTVMEKAVALAAELADRIRAIEGYRLWQDELGMDACGHGESSHRVFSSDKPSHGVPFRDSMKNTKPRQNTVAGACLVDPRKLTISAQDIGLSGFTLADILAKEYRIDVELAAESHILCIVNPGHSEEDIDRLADALTDIRERHTKNTIRGKNRIATDVCGAARATSDTTKSADSAGRKKKRAADRTRRTMLSSMYGAGQKPYIPAITPREAFFAARRTIRLDQSSGCLSAAAVIPYPPGIPLLFPGALITRESAQAVADWVRAGHACTGIRKKGDHLWIEIVDSKN